MKSIVGYTGFVGSNICRSTYFDKYYNTKNIDESFGTNPDLLIYSGIKAEKYIANKFPQKDYDHIAEAIKNIEKIAPKKLVLISTIDVYKNSDGKFEDEVLFPGDVDTYGRNRLLLENWVKSHIKDSHIIRLPGLYGKNIKKNFIYDAINVVPKILTVDKYNDLFSNENDLKNFYFLDDNGFYKCKDVDKEKKSILKKFFLSKGFSALNFTDSRGCFQFYNLKYLWDHIQVVLKNDLRVVNMATEPVVIGELYEAIYNNEFINYISDKIPHYNFKTKYCKEFSGSNGYIWGKDLVVKDIINFINRSSGETINI